MNSYMEQLQEVQKFAFERITEYPLDREAANVLAELVNARNQDRRKFFELNKIQGSDARKVFYELAASGTIAQWLENHALLEYINS